LIGEFAKARFGLAELPFRSSDLARDGTGICALAWPPAGINFLNTPDRLARLRLSDVANGKLRWSCFSIAPSSSTSAPRLSNAHVGRCATAAPAGPLTAIGVAGGYARLVGIESFDRTIEVAELGVEDAAPEEAAHPAQLKAGSPTCL